MKRHLTQWTVGRESRASTYFAILFGTSVLTILAIRAFLAATGYPQIGGNSLHIAHMLWGGLFMLVAIIILLYVHGHRAKVIGSVIGGVGFGFFIDELGKFITNDNDYFYQPTAMLLYLIFLLLWALFEWLDNYVPSTPRQKFIDLLTRVRDGSIHGLSHDDIVEIRGLLADLQMSKKAQTDFLAYVETYAPVYQPDGLVQLINAGTLKAEQSMKYIVKNRATPLVIYIIVTLSAVASFVVLLLTLFNSQNIFDIYQDVPVFIEAGLVIATTVTLGCVAAGVSYTKRNWYKTLIWYRRALLVNIFGTQVFLFYVNQFTTAFGLMVSLLFLYIITVLVHEYGKK